MKKALIVIDIQNDYFSNGKFPLWNTENTLNNVEKAIEKANANDIPVILVQHIADSSSPFCTI
jgi:nicotinamidase-related amidase